MPINLTDLLNEVTYNKFKTSIKHRNNSEQLHKAIKEVKVKLSEIDRLIEHTSRLKQELCEDDANIPYWSRTTKNIHSLKETTLNIYKKLNTLIK